MPYDLPNMGVNYGTLAQLSAPQMMPNAPMGAGATAGQMYYQDKARQEAALNQAGGLAALDAQMRSGAAGEYNAGAPGRMADIQTQNALAQGRSGDLPHMLTKQSEEAKAGANTATAQRIQSEIAKLSPYSDLWAAAKTPEERAAVVNQIKQKEGGKIGDRHIDEIPPEKLDQLMTVVRRSAVNTPKHAQQMEVEDVRYKREIEKFTLLAEARKEVARTAASWHEKIIASGKKMEDPNRFVFYKLMENAKSEPERQAAVEWYQNSQLEVAKARAGNQPQQNDIKFPEGSPIQARPPIQPQAVPPPGTLGSQGTPPSISQSAPAAPKAPPQAITKYKQLIQQANGDKALIERINGDWKVHFGELPQ
jgi:hypothetical protein